MKTTILCIYIVTCQIFHRLIIKLFLCNYVGPHVLRIVHPNNKISVYVDKYYIMKCINMLYKYTLVSQHVIYKCVPILTIQGFCFSVFSEKLKYVPVVFCSYCTSSTAVGRSAPEQTQKSNQQSANKHMNPAPPYQKYTSRHQILQTLSTVTD